VLPAEELVVELVGDAVDLRAEVGRRLGGDGGA
jgi:hypothetical protein